MKRREFLHKAGIGMAAVGAAATLPASKALGAEKPIVWKVVTSYPPKFPFFQEGTERMATLIERMSGGRMKWQVYAAGEMVGPLEVFDAVSQGRVTQAGSTASFFYAGKSPETQIFSSLPFGMPYRGVMGWLYAGGGIDLFRKYYKRFNLYPIQMIATGTEMGGWYRKEINSIDDYRGLKMRIAGLGGRVLAKAGVNVVNVPPSDLFTALERGVIDAADLVNPYIDKRTGLYQVAKYYYHPGWQEPCTTTTLIVNLKVWEDLADDLKAIIEAACAETVSWTIGQGDLVNAEALKELTQKHGVIFKRLPDDVLQQLRKYADEVMEEETAKNANFKEVYESYKKFQANFTDWMNVSEWSYIDALRKTKI
jgi:TRAP-type mannitol/chloroaromatic compound transport system substrate-binding protein